MVAIDVLERLVPRIAKSTMNLHRAVSRLTAQPVRPVIAHRDFVAHREIADRVHLPGRLVDQRPDHLALRLQLDQRELDRLVRRQSLPEWRTYIRIGHRLIDAELRSAQRGRRLPYPVLVEEMLHDLSASNPAWRIACLRYFNPVGAHDSGLIGEDPNGIPNNLMPFVAQVAAGLRPAVQVFGNDYDTPDGTGVRDYIHVMDLAQGHLAALHFLQAQTGWHAINLGTGQGHSVLEMVKAFEAASGKPVAFNIVPRRPGDVASCYAKVDKAQTLLNWQASRGLPQMCEDAWRAQQRNMPSTN